MSLFVPSCSSHDMSFEDYMKEKEAWKAMQLRQRDYIEDALKLPGETGGEWLNAFMELSLKDRDELLEQARKEIGCDWNGNLLG